jgi:hypothetical protein
MKKILIIAIVLIFASCVNNGQKRASRKIHRKLDKVEKLIKLYPELSDSIYTTHTDTITIKGSIDSISYALKKDTLYVDSILKAYERLYKHKASIEQQIQDSLLKYDNQGFDIKSATQRDNDMYRHSMYFLKLENDRVDKELEMLKYKLVNRTIENSYFEYSDTLIDANIHIVDGKLKLVYEIKDREIVHETKVKSIEIKKKDVNYIRWLWIMSLIIVLILLYLNVKKYKE